MTTEVNCILAALREIVFLIPDDGESLNSKPFI